MPNQIKLDGELYSIENATKDQLISIEKLKFAENRILEIKKMRSLLETSKDSIIRDIKREMLAAKGGFIIE